MASVFAEGKNKVKSTRLVARYLAGNAVRPEAVARAKPSDDQLAELYKTHWAGLCRYIRGKFGAGPPEPEDIVQSAFLKFATLPDRNLIQNPSAYIGRIASNLVLDDKRKVRSHNGYLKEVGATIRLEEELAPGSDRVLIGREHLGVISKTIRGMPRKRRRILILNRVHGMSLAEIGRRMGMSAPGVRKHLMRGLQELQAALAKYEGGQA